MAGIARAWTCGLLPLISAASALGGCSNVLGITGFTPAEEDAGTDVSPVEGDDAGKPAAGSDRDAGGGDRLDAASDGATPREDASADAESADARGADDARSAEPDADTADAAPPACRASESRCVGSAVQSCDASGNWSAPLACSASQSCADGACVERPSCPNNGPGLSDCGLGRESCCTSIALPAGSYHRTFTPSASGPATRLGAPATVSAFGLDKYLVTVGRFRKFVAAWSGGTGFTPAVGAGKHTHVNGGEGLTLMGGSGREPGWRAADTAAVSPTAANLGCFARDQTWTDVAASHESLPINCVTWAEAYAFCIWDGGFLPSEAEWEYASAGGSEQRKYAWGNNEPGTGNQYAIFKCLFPNGPAVLGAGVCNGTNIAPVGSVPLGAARWGHLDLAGELWEWTLDSYPGPSLPPGYNDACIDCVFQSSAPDRLVRGGQFANPESSLESTFRENGPAGGRYPGVGIRCARSL